MNEHQLENLAEKVADKMKARPDHCSCQKKEDGISQHEVEHMFLRQLMELSKRLDEVRWGTMFWLLKIFALLFCAALVYFVGSKVNQFLPGG